MPSVPTAGDAEAARRPDRTRRRAAANGSASTDRRPGGGSSSGHSARRVRATSPCGYASGAHFGEVADGAGRSSSSGTSRLARGAHPRQQGRSAARAGSPSERPRPAGSGAWDEQTGAVNALIDDLVSADGRDRARDRRSRRRRPLPSRSQLRMEGQALKGEFLRIGTTVNAMVDQLSSIRRRGHAGRARGRHRGQARWPGEGEGRLRNLEGPHRLRQPDGVEPHRPGAQHRRGDDGRCDRRPFEEGHGRRQGRDFNFKNTVNTMVDQLSDLRRRGHARRPRGRERGQARRAGPGSRASAASGRT